MWQPLSNILDLIGRCRISIGPSKVVLSVGHPESTDATGTMDWQRFLTAEALHDVWGPAPGSPWQPYHCVPLFAALDTLPKALVGPTPREMATHFESVLHISEASSSSPLGQNWVSERVGIFIDLPGVQSVPLAFRLALAGYQPVCTFDHWPHPAGLLHPELILAQLIRFAPLMESARFGIRPENPPIWVCDRNRLGTVPGLPRQFDNRYFLDDSVLPGLAALKAAGIQHLICIVPTLAEPPLEDLLAWLFSLQKAGFKDIHVVALSDPSLAPYDLPPGKLKSRINSRRFQRSAAGGFGRLIPEESSSGGS